jgi:hypothetical protein
MPPKNVSRDTAGMGEGIQYRISAAEYSRENIDRQREPIHLRKQCHKKGESYTHGAPLSLFDRCKKAQDEEGKQNDIDNNERPESVGKLKILSVHGSPHKQRENSRYPLHIIVVSLHALQEVYFFQPCLDNKPYKTEYTGYHEGRCWPLQRKPS